MAKHPPDERVVYLACRTIFRGEAAQTRNAEPVRKLVQQNRPQLQQLLDEHGLDPVCRSVPTLLAQQVFESTVRAKIKFPELFEVSPAQSADREASEAEAARMDADTIADAANRCASQPEPQENIDAAAAGESEREIYVPASQ